MHNMRQLQIVTAADVLEEVGGGISFKDLTSVKDIIGFGELETVGGDLQMLDLNALETNEASNRIMFRKVKSIAGQLRVYDTFTRNALKEHNLQSHTWFTALEQCKSINLHGGRTSMDLRGAFPNLIKVGNVEIGHGRFRLNGEKMFAILEQIDGGLSIESIKDCPEDHDEDRCMHNFEGWFPKLKSVKERLRIAESSAVTGFGFDSLQRVGNFQLQNLPLLAMCKSKLDRLINVVSSSNDEDQIRPATVNDC